MPFQWSPGPAEISIHTTTQVVTWIQCGPYLYMRISIHTTTQVVTGGGDHKGCQAVYFNPHHHAGGDTMTIENAPEATDFNPHHHAGGD